ncbi:MAG: hypothetical protein V4449_01360 [Patescibacteria group bacterium]
MDLIFGIAGIALPILFVAAIAWHEGLLSKWVVYIAFSILAIIFYSVFLRNLAEWQMGLFGLLFALALVGINALFGRK